MKQTVNHNGNKAQITTNSLGAFEVSINGKKIGEFVFSDGHNGYAGFSNSFGVDCYQLTHVGNKTVWGSGPLHSSKRSACIDLIARAQADGVI